MRGLRTDFGHEGGDPGEPPPPGGGGAPSGAGASPGDSGPVTPDPSAPATAPPSAGSSPAPVASGSDAGASPEPSPAAPLPADGATAAPVSATAATPPAPAPSTPSEPAAAALPGASTPSTSTEPAPAAGPAPVSPEPTPAPGHAAPPPAPAHGEPAHSPPLPALPETFAPTGSTPLLRALEARVAQAALGAPGGLVLALGASKDELRGALGQLWSTTAGRSIHVNVPAGSQPTEAAVRSLVETLTARGPRGPHAPPGTRLLEERVRPGCAALVDPLVARAAAFVLGPDEVSSIGIYLGPDALDESPAVAARLIAKRFLPAFVVQMPQVPTTLLAALLRARCGGPDDAPDFATVAGELGPAAFLRALGVIAARAGVAVVLVFEGGLETPAATAHLALEVPTGPAFALVVPVDRSVWDAQRVLLSDEERARAEERIVDGSLPEAERSAAAAAAAPPPVAPAPDTQSGAPARTTPRARAAARRKAESGTGAALPADPNAPGAVAPVVGAPGTPAAPAAVPVATLGSPAFQEQLRRAVAARLAKPDPKNPAAPATADPAAAGAPAATAAPAAPPPRWEPPRGPSALQKIVLAVAPFLFLASLPILGRNEPEAKRSGGPSNLKPIPVAPAKGEPPRDGGKADGGKNEGTKLDAPKGPKLGAPQPAPPQRPSGPARPQPPASQPQAPAGPPGPALSKLDQALHDLEQELTTLPPGAQGAAIDRKLAGLERDDQARALVRLLEHGNPGMDPVRLAEIERTSGYLDVPVISEKVATLLQPASPRTERLAALQAVQRAPQTLTPELKATVQALARGDADIAVETQAQQVLLALGESVAPNPPGGVAPPNPNTPGNPPQPDPNGAPPWPPADPYNPQPPPPR